jgi:hypothetical protein
MKDLFVSYEQALELKELGFDEPCLAFYNGKFLDSTEYDFDSCVSKDIRDCVLAPLKQQVYVWFIEKQGLNSWILSISDPKETDTKYSYEIKNCDDKLLFDNLEEAEDACIDKLIEILKQK